MTVFKVNNRPVAQSWNGLVSDLFSGLENNFGPAFTQPSAGNVPVNIAETDENYQLEVSAPGRSKENFTLNVENNTLSIGYEEKKETETKDDTKQPKQVRREFSFRSFKRSFNLDENKIDADGIVAKYEDGILKVTLPKKAEPKPETRQISIQ